MKIKRIVVNISISLITTIVCLFIGEYILRSLIFSKNPAFEKLRDPGDYSDPNSEDDYWKLYYLFGGEFKPPENPHPLLGWTGTFYEENYTHWNSHQINNRRPVLLYGNSFAQCVPASICFQKILNNDTTFAKENYFLNYGVGGYGVDQISLLFKNSYHLYNKPFVVFGLLTTDLDRSILSVRTGQKPYYVIKGDSLQLTNVPINKNPKDYFDNNPPQIKSYLFRKFLYGKTNFLPKKLTSYLKKEKEYTNKKITINEKILLDVVNTLRNNNVDFIFVIFQFLEYGIDNWGEEGENNWRNVFLKGFLEKNNVPYIWTRDLIKNDTTYDKNDIPKYIIPGDGHPTTHFNLLIAKEIKKAVLACPVN